MVLDSERASKSPSAIKFVIVGAADETVEDELLDIEVESLIVVGSLVGLGVGTRVVKVEVISILLVGSVDGEIIVVGSGVDVIDVSSNEELDVEVSRLADESVGK